MIAFSPWVPRVIAAWVLVPLVALLVIGLVRAWRKRVGVLREMAEAGAVFDEHWKRDEFNRDVLKRVHVARMAYRAEFGQGAVSRVPRSSDPAAASGSADHGPAHGVAERDGSPAAPVSPDWQPDLRGVCSPERLSQIADDVAALHRIPASVNVSPEFLSLVEANGLPRMPWTAVFHRNGRATRIEIIRETVNPFLSPAEPNLNVTVPAFVVQR